jgi:predicted naringenin-chalcone synthase
MARQGTGFQVILSARSAAWCASTCGRMWNALLAEHRLDYDDIAVWVTHPAARRCCRRWKTHFRSSRAALDLSWESLGESGT